MRGLNPAYLAKLDEDQQVTALTASGKFFLDSFVHIRGNHGFVIGTTGSGKTNLGEWLVSWLKHTECQIWMDSGKSDEILPLLCQGKPVRLIVPKYADVFIEERINGKWQKIENHPEVSHVDCAGSTWFAVAGNEGDKDWNYYPNKINILCFRNAFWSSSRRAEWMTDLFTSLAEGSRLRSLPSSLFPFTLHIDEAQWAVSGSRISKDSDRAKSSEIITENVLEIRSAGGRIVAYVQGFLNLPPAMRDNLVCAFLLRGADIHTDENKRLAKACQADYGIYGSKAPINFKRGELKYVAEDGKTDRPWKIPLFPKSEEDRKWLKRCRVRYEGFNDRRPATAETEEECLPELGRFSAMAIPPERQIELYNRFGAETAGEIDYDR
jgi:hypothetical protein